MSKSDIPYKIYLEENEIPTTWYNVRADMKEKPAPLLNPGTLEPLKFEEMQPIFCDELIKQELDDDTRDVPIPDQIQDFYRMYRPSPLIHAEFLEKALDTPAKIFYKFEGSNTSGSHKLNSAIAQAYYAKQQGLKGVTTETGAGQWGTALAMVSNLYDLDTTVFMVKGSYMAKPLRKTIINTYGAKIYASPSEYTEFGKKILKENPNTSGSLGIAISEACELAANDPGTNYSLGSVLNHVMLHQTVIGQEVIKQMEIAEITPDYVVACTGGGSNFGGTVFPMLGQKIRGEGFKDTQFIAVEPKAAPSLTEGEFKYDFGDTGGFTPLLMMYTLGSEFIPSAIHAGGLRYHGMSPLVSEAYNTGMISARSYDQPDTFEAGMLFARTEGIIPAPESCHALKGAIDLALDTKAKNEEKTIVFTLSGHGLLDLYGYEQFMDGTLPSSKVGQ